MNLQLQYAAVKISRYEFFLFYIKSIMKYTLHFKLV